MTTQTLTDRETACLARVIEIGDAVDFGGRHASKADRKAVEHLIEMGLLKGTYRSASATKATPKEVKGPPETTDKVANVKPADKPKTKDQRPVPEGAVAILKGVPMPKPKPAVAVIKYPFADLEIDGMFFLPGKTTSRFASYASLQGRTLNRKFRTRTITMRKVDPDAPWTECEPSAAGAQTGVGVWRVE